MTRRLVAYSDRFSAHPGERVEFKVNAMGGTLSATRPGVVDAIVS